MVLLKNINHPAKGSSIKVEPIKDKKDIKAIEDLLADIPRNLALFTLGISTGLRINDLLKIKAGQVRSIHKSKEIKIKNNRSGKEVRIPLNKASVDAVQRLIRSKEEQNGGPLNPDDFLFTGYRNVSLTVPYVNNLIKKWCAAINLQGNFGCHTLRKTFGYQQLLRSEAGLKDLMLTFNHSMPFQTLEYLCILPEMLSMMQNPESAMDLIMENGRAAKTINDLEKENVNLKQDMAKLLVSEEKFKTLFENANDLIVYMDLDGYLIDLNNKLEEVSGYKRKDFIGKHYTELSVLSKDYSSKINRDFENATSGNFRDVMEFEVIRKDGKKVFVEVHSNMIKKGGKEIAFVSIIRDITERKQAEMLLRMHRDRLEELVKERTIKLEEANTALKVLLKRTEADKSELEEKIVYNVNKSIEPYLEKLKKLNLTERASTYINIMESNINNIVSPLMRNLSTKFLKLTPTEIQIANLITEGKTTKEIAEIFILSPRTIEFHRDNIRKKLGLKKKRTNLRTYLLTLQ